MQYAVEVGLTVDGLLVAYRPREEVLLGKSTHDRLVLTNPAAVVRFQRSS